MIKFGNLEKKLIKKLGKCIKNKNKKQENIKFEN